ncbi:MAG: sulfurtransferase-like selenium metabolism protein YedF [Dehalococcoidia bacterium]|nr:sulfurtransferase-like selenium metabolism protein YedF [Dehalococcoidia bacterium]MDZ4246450.1 sulfurtransferase-like selenium metabolism protein YedF [Dehalococcoidia bacterium]
MSKETVDARTLACPAPVMRAAEAMKRAGEVLVIVDNPAARDNVSQLAKNEGWSSSIETRDDGIYLTLKKSSQAQPAKKGESGSVVVLIASEFLGRGENVQLGSLLMQSFLHTLNGLSVEPETIIFINSGVKLVAVSSPVIEDLKLIQARGIEILACGTCLSHFNLLDKVAVGQVSNMMTIADTLLRTERVISL